MAACSGCWHRPLNGSPCLQWVSEHVLQPRWLNEATQYSSSVALQRDLCYCPEGARWLTYNAQTISKPYSVECLASLSGCLRLFPLISVLNTSTSLGKWNQKEVLWWDEKTLGDLSEHVATGRYAVAESTSLKWPAGKGCWISHMPMLSPQCLHCASEDECRCFLLPIEISAMLKIHA